MLQMGMTTQMPLTMMSLMTIEDLGLGRLELLDVLLNLMCEPKFVVVLLMSLLSYLAFSLYILRIYCVFWRI